MDRQQAPPTYLNYRNGSTVQSSDSLPQPPLSPTHRPPPPPPPPAAAQPYTNNTLLIFISDAPSPDLPIYLSTILSRYSIAEALVIATSDEVLKVVRMHLYTAAGKLRQDILVSPHKIEGPLTLADLAKATRTMDSKTLSGVLCCQHLHASVEPDVPPTPRDMLDYDESELELSWRTNLLTLHTLARATVPHLRRAPLHPSPFFCLDSSLPLSALDRATQDAFLTQLSTSPASQGLRFGLAKEELIPAPTPSVSEQHSQKHSLASLEIPETYSNGNGVGVGNGNGMYYGGGGGQSPGLESPMSESPTKLWASWAMMNE